MIQMVIQNLFLEHTSYFPDWRVVEIQFRIIEHEVNSAATLADVQQSSFLQAWFEQLTKTAEAHRCIHYMFKQKLAMIEFKELGWDDMQKLYDKFEILAKASPETGKKSNNLASQVDELGTPSS